MLELLKALFWVIVAGLLRFLGLTHKRITHPDPVMEEMRKRGYDPDKVEKIVPDEAKQRMAEQLGGAAEAIIQSDEQLGENPFTQNEAALLISSTIMAAGLMDTPDVQLRPHFQFLGSSEDPVLKVTFSALESSGQPKVVKNMIGADTIELRGRPNTNAFVTELAKLAMEEAQATLAREVPNGNQESESGQD